MAAAPLAIPFILEALEAAISSMLISIGVITVGKQVAAAIEEQKRRNATSEALEGAKNSTFFFSAEPPSPIVKCALAGIEHSKGDQVLMAEGAKDTDVEADSDTPAAHNASEYEKLKKQLRRETGKPEVQDPELKNLVDKNYRDGAEVGSGSTADAIRNERAKGKPTKGSWHKQKGEGMITALEKWLKNHPRASAGDRAAAENVLKDLKDALGK